MWSYLLDEIGKGYVEGEERRISGRGNEYRSNKKNKGDVNGGKMRGRLAGEGVGEGEGRVVTRDGIGLDLGEMGREIKWKGRKGREGEGKKKKERERR